MIAKNNGNGPEKFCRSSVFFCGHLGASVLEHWSSVFGITVVWSDCWSKTQTYGRRTVHAFQISTVQNLPLRTRCAQGGQKNSNYHGRYFVAAADEHYDKWLYLACILLPDHLLLLCVDGMDDGWRKLTR